MAHTDRQPKDDIFQDLKQAAIVIWSRYDDTYGYATEKIDRVNSIENYADNWYTFLGMFDTQNQAKMMLEIKLDKTFDFLVVQHAHYRYVRPILYR